MREDTGILLYEPTEGLGYQAAGALQRLGRRMIGLMKPDSDRTRLKHIPMPFQTADLDAADFETGAHHFSREDIGSVLITPEPHLARNLALSDDDLAAWEQRIRRLRKSLASPIFILVLPRSSSQTQVNRLRVAAGRSIVLVTPAVFGFRDASLFDRALELVDTNPALLLRMQASAKDAEWPLVSAADVASFVISAALRPEVEGQVLEVPPVTRSRGEFLTHFLKHFAADQDSLWNRLRATWQSESASPAGYHWPHFSTEKPPLHIDAQVMEVLPSPLTPLDRSLRDWAGHHRRQPEIELVFPPGRSL